MLLAILIFASISLHAMTDCGEREGAQDQMSSSIHDFFNASFINEEHIPLILTPKDDNRTMDEVKIWIQNYPNELIDLIDRYGALLLRGFPVHEIDEFSEIIESIFQEPLIDYRGGEELRKKVCEGIYSSAEIPPQSYIPLHNELSCTYRPPRYISFFCDIPPTLGTGQAILGKTAQISQAIENHSMVWDFFNGETIKYISRHPPEGNYYSSINETHKTWQEVFETTNQEDVEALCLEKGFDFTWYGDWLEVYRYVPAIKGPDEYFEFPYWFNQLHLYHLNPRLCGGWFNYQLTRLLYLYPHTKPYDVELANGTLIPREIVYTIYDVLEENMIVIKWQEKDVLMINNNTTLHGRLSYSKEERILISMIE